MYWNKWYYEIIVLNIGLRMRPPAPSATARPLRPQPPAQSACPPGPPARSAHPVGPQPRPAFYNAF